MISRNRSVSTAAAMSIERTTSANSAVTCLYSAGVVAVATAAPHSLQNFEFGGSSVPHDPHNSPAAVMSRGQPTVVHINILSPMASPHAPSRHSDVYGDTSDDVPRAAIDGLTGHSGYDKPAPCSINYGGENRHPAHHRRGRLGGVNPLARPAGRSQSLRVASPVAPAVIVLLTPDRRPVHISKNVGDMCVSEF